MGPVVVLGLDVLDGGFEDVPAVEEEPVGPPTLEDVRERVKVAPIVIVGK
jgi:hypothetical protein